MSALEAWSELMSGQVRIKGQLVTDTHCYITVESNAEAAPVLTPQQVRIFETVATGEPQKAVAMALGRSSSSISAVLRVSLQALGLPCQFRRMPLLLAILAHHRCCRAHAELRPVRLVCESGSSLIALRRPDNSLRGGLTRAEYEVMRLVIEGKSHVEIATLRGVSRRTIANQIRVLFRKLGVSGRFQLLARALGEHVRTNFDREVLLEVESA